MQFFSPVFLAVLVGSPLFATAQALPPSWVQHVRPVLEHVSRHRRAGDRIYVAYGAGLAFGYYAPRVGIPAHGVERGRCTVTDPKEYLRELDAFRGEPRVWVVITHLQRDGELQLLRGYLDEIGQRVDSVFIPASSGREIEHAYGYLYDLSDLARLDSADADTYPLPQPLREPVSESLKTWGCYGITGGETSITAFQTF